jgi:hypothetical protein
MTNTLVAKRSESRVAQLLEVAMLGIESMYDPEAKLFCHRLKRTPHGLVREGISHRYTMMTLLGLLRAESAGFQSSISTPVTLNRLLDETGWLDNIGDLGLLLWLCALSSREDLVRFCEMFDIENALSRYPDGRGRLTMELSWFLTGLAYGSEMGAEPPSAFAHLANETYRLLLANQGPHGIFGHMAKWGSLAGVVRGHVGSFADQVYPIYALSHFARVFQINEAYDHALRCANAMCRRQGPLGQWWWHYDSVAGDVVEHYPVYSVHQHAMAPMALFALQDTGRADLSEHVSTGLGWINGKNELQQDLEDDSEGVIWRCIRPSTSHAARIRTWLGREHHFETMRILHECRPYELGWLLYAHARPGSLRTQS